MADIVLATGDPKDAVFTAGTQAHEAAMETSQPEEDMILIPDSPKEMILTTGAQASGTTMETSPPSALYGTRDYNQLRNKPSINGVELVGDLVSGDIGVMEEDDIQISIVTNQDIEDMINHFVWGD